MARIAWMRLALARFGRASPRLIADIAHEVRTPMTGVLGMSELLLEGRLQPEQRRQVEAIREAGEHLLRVVDGALDMAKAGAGRLRPDRRPFDPRALLESAASLHAPLARRRGLEVALDVDPALPRIVVGDALRVRQVLFNLLGNALKFTENGRVGLHASCAPAGGLRFVVSDTGPGLGAAQRARLFRRFEPLGTAGAPGSGLGLAISRELAEAMGGRIAVDSAPGEGARFVVDLPLFPP